MNGMMNKLLEYSTYETKINENIEKFKLIPLRGSGCVYINPYEKGNRVLLVENYDLQRKSDLRKGVRTRHARAISQSLKKETSCKQGRSLFDVAAVAKKWLADRIPRRMQWHLRPSIAIYYLLLWGKLFSWIPSPRRRSLDRMIMPHDALRLLLSDTLILAEFFPLCEGSLIAGLLCIYEPRLCGCFVYSTFALCTKRCSDARLPTSLFESVERN